MNRRGALDRNDAEPHRMYRHVCALIERHLVLLARQEAEWLLII